MTIIHICEILSFFIWFLSTSQYKGSIKLLSIPYPTNISLLLSGRQLAQDLARLLLPSPGLTYNVREVDKGAAQDLQAKQNKLAGHFYKFIMIFS